MFAHKFIFFYIFLLIGFASSSQDELLTIKGAVELALKKNPELNQERSILKQKSEQWRTMTGISSPEVSFMKEGINNQESNPFGERRYSISQSIDSPLSTIYRLKGVEKEKIAYELKIAAIEKDIIVEVKSQYVGVVYALHLQQMRRQQINLAKELYNAVYAKFETGMGNGLDLIKAELQVAEAENDLDESEKILHQARYGLFKAIGLRIEEQKYSIQFTDTLQAAEERVSQQYVMNNLNKQPLYKSALIEQEATQNKIKEAKSNLFPDLRFDLYKQDYGNGFDYNGFEIGLSIPLWLPLEQKGKIRIAEALNEETQWKQQAIISEMKKEVEDAWHGYITSKTTIERFQETIQSKAEKLQSLTLEAYRIGEIDLLNLINAQQIYLNSQLRYISALRDYYLKMIALEKYMDEELVY